jgi:hypothetical protein
MWNFTRQTQICTNRTVKMGELYLLCFSSWSWLTNILLIKNVSIFEVSRSRPAKPMHRCIFYFSKNYATFCCKIGRNRRHSAVIGAFVCCDWRTVTLEVLQDFAVRPVMGPSMHGVCTGNLLLT